MILVIRALAAAKDTITRPDCLAGSPRSRQRERTFSRGWSRPDEPVGMLRQTNGTGFGPRGSLQSSSGLGSMPSIATSGSDCK